MEQITARCAGRLFIPKLKANPMVKNDRGYSPPGLGDPEGRIPARIAPISELSEILDQTQTTTVKTSDENPISKK